MITATLGSARRGYSAEADQTGIMANVPDVVSMEEWPTYTYAQVDRLLKLHGGTARRWINGYAMQGRIYKPIVRKQRTDSEWVTWGEFLEAKLIAHYRDVGKVPTLRIRQAIERLRELSGLRHPLAHWHTFIEASGRELLLQAQQDLEGPGSEFSFTERLRDGQILLLPWVRQFVEEAEGEALSTAEYDDTIVATQLEASFPDILSVAQLRSGLPTLRNRNVLAATVADLIDSGEPKDDVAEWYDVAVELVDQAVGFVHARRRAVA